MAVRLGQCLGPDGARPAACLFRVGHRLALGRGGAAQSVQGARLLRALLEVPWRELYEGRPILVPEMPRTYVPTLFAVQMPEVFLALSVSGAAGALVAALFGSAPAARRAQYMLLVAAAMFPVLLTVVERPVM